MVARRVVRPPGQNRLRLDFVNALFGVRRIVSTI